jgi:hypothetical protein
MDSMLMMLWLTLAGLAPHGARARRPPAFRGPWLEALEDRTVPSNFTAGTVADLITIASSTSPSPTTWC